MLVCAVRPCTWRVSNRVEVPADQTLEFALQVFDSCFVLEDDSLGLVWDGPYLGGMCSAHEGLSNDRLSQCCQ